VFSDLMLFSDYFLVWAFMMRCRQAGMDVFEKFVVDTITIKDQGQPSVGLNFF